LAEIFKDKGLLLVSVGKNVMRVLPPLIIEEKHILEAFGILEECFLGF